jgi:hypothetical protein
MRRLLALLLLTSVTATTASQPARDAEIERIAAFARLYGVVRYFYPSDAAAALDWDRFAVHGVTQVRAAHDPNSLQGVLRDLFSPLGPGLVLAKDLPPGPAPGGDDNRLIAWRYFGPGFAVSGTPEAYRGKRTNRAVSAGPSIDGFVTLMQSVPAEALRGKAIRLRGTVRAAAADPAGAAALWLRVDRPDRAVGFFDNMGNRPVRDPEWQEYAIEGVVADDATHVAFGVMASGPVTADFDRIELTVRGAQGAGAPVEIPILVSNRGPIRNPEAGPGQERPRRPRSRDPLETLRKDASTSASHLRQRLRRSQPSCSTTRHRLRARTSMSISDRG